MKLSQFSSHDLIELDLKSKTKEEVLKELVDILSKSSSITDRQKVYDSLIEREKLGSTGVGLGIAFPHARTSGTRALSIAFGRSKKGVDFDSIDKKSVKFFFLVVSPEELHSEHLQVLAKLSLIMHKNENILKAMEAEFPQQILDLMDLKKEPFLSHKDF
jgi:PTS system fructose-specific IIA component/PTS system nitrogen regulatory IIA component